MATRVLAGLGSKCLSDPGHQVALFQHESAQALRLKNIDRVDLSPSGKNSMLSIRNGSISGRE